MSLSLSIIFNFEYLGDGQQQQHFKKTFFFLLFSISRSVLQSFVIFYPWLGKDPFKTFQSRLKLSNVFNWKDFLPRSLGLCLWTKSDIWFAIISVHVGLFLNPFPNLSTSVSSSASSISSSVVRNSTNTIFKFFMLSSCIHQNMRLYLTSSSFCFLMFSYLSIEFSIAYNLFSISVLFKILHCMQSYKLIIPFRSS